MAKPILTIGLEQLTTGVMPGVNEDSVPLWIELTDVLVEGAGLRPLPGYDNVNVASGMFDDPVIYFDDMPGEFDSAEVSATISLTGTTPVKGIHQQRQRSQVPMIAFGDDRDLYLFNSDVTWQATRQIAGNFVQYNGTDAATEVQTSTHWSFAQWGDWILATNGIDVPQLWKSTYFADLTNFPASAAEIVRVLGPHAVFFNLKGNYTPTGLPADTNQIAWCKQDDVEQWNPLTTGNATAGELTIREIPGPIIAAEHLGQNILMYSEQGVHILSYGGDFLFTAQKGVTGVKALSKNSIAVVGNVHYGLTESGIFVTDGLTFQPRAFPKFGDWLERNVDWDRKSKIVHLVDLQRGTVTWTVPLLAGGNKGIVYHYQNDALSFDARPFTAATRRGPLAPIVGFSTGEIRQVTDTPTDRTPVAITKPLAVGNRDSFAYLDTLIGRWNGAAATVSVRYAEHQDELDSAEWTVLGSFTTKENMLHMVREAVFVQFKIESAELSEIWTLSGLDVYGKAGGRRL